MKKIFSLILSLTFVFSTSPVFAATATLSAIPTTATINTNAAPVFTRSLGIGTVGQDVEALKKILSLEVGSTDTGATYTSTTAAAVSQLQNKYAVEILIPLGLSAPTGYVGPSTIAELNIIAATDNITLSQFASVALPTSTAGQIFTQTLSLGSTGSQVLLLKSVLSLDLGITLSNTDIFDQATQNAVNQFQQKYAAVILTPIGLTAPTGIVGPATRAKLNALLANNLALASAAGSATISTTTQSVNLNPSEGSANGSGEITSYTSNSSGVTTNTTPLCPIESVTYGSWGPCQQDGIQTRTASTTIVSWATCPFNNPTPITTQSCAIEQCPTAVTFAGEVGTETLCLLPVNGITAYVALDFKAGVEYEDSSGNACTITNGDDRLLFPLGDLTLQEQSTQIGGLKGGVGGSTYDAPDGLFGLGTTNTSEATCQLWSGTVQMRVINPGNSDFGLQN
jgi:hypothetical protein